jgi:hypothetical protein
MMIKIIIILFITLKQNIGGLVELKEKYEF